MTLQFLINHYEEPPEKIRELLSSIAAMQHNDNLDVSVLICNDGYENELPDDVLIGWPFGVEYFAKAWGGVCQTRNALLDAATADYVTFCDGDDVLHGCNTFNDLADVLDGEPLPDYVFSPFHFERRERKPMIVSDALVWVFGKIYNLEFLRENDIRFPDEQKISGDMYFIWQARAIAKRKAEIPPFYLWRRNPNSVTRGEPWHWIKTYPTLIKTHDLLIEKFLERGMAADAKDVVLKTISMAYIDAHSNTWEATPPELKSVQDEAFDSVATYTKKYSSAYACASKEARKKAYNVQLIKKRTYGPADGLEGVIPWIEKIAK